MPEHEQPSIDKQLVAQPACAPSVDAATLLLSQATQQAKNAYQRDDWTEAERLCRWELSGQPDQFEALNLLGIIAAQTQRPQEAIELLSRAIAVNPNHATAHSNLGNVLHDLKRYEEALESFNRALKINPDDSDTHYRCSGILGTLNRYEEALESCDHALKIRPDYVEALNNRGNALNCLNRPHEALESFDRALKIMPDYADAYNNRGVVLSSLQRREEALESFDRALRIKPDFADARWNIAPFHLQLGDFERGWTGYEWRWQTVKHSNANGNFSQPLWLGAESLDGKTILLHSEQGLGDTLHFCRYVKLVAAKGARVILEVQPQLLPLLADLEGAVQVFPKGAALPTPDYHCPLLSLPLAFKTDLETIPAGIPYIHSNAARVAAWRNRLGKKTRPRIGLVWSGSATQKNDHNRSLALAELLPLLHDEAEWISLQQEVRAGDAALLAQRVDIRHFGNELKDFADTAALVELMDVVVTVCTSVAHLAGAMGKPVWILLCFNPDWRWLLDREDSPWYPTAHLFRQPAAGDWRSVIDRVSTELALRHPDLYVAAPAVINADNQPPHSGRASRGTLTWHAQDHLQSPIAGNTSKLLIYSFLIGLVTMTIWLLLS